MEQKTNKWLGRTVLFISGQTVSLFGSMLVQYAIIWYITLKTGSGVTLSIATVCAFIPQIFVSFFAGVWADRYNRKMLIMLSDLMIAAVTLALALCFASGYREIWLLYVVAAVRSVGAGIQTPAVSAFIPQLVPQDNLMKINGFNGSVQAVMMLVSPAVAALILKYAVIDFIFYIDVVTALLGAGFRLLIRVEPHIGMNRENGGNYLHELSEGLRYVAREKWLSVMFAFQGVAMFLITPAAFLTPLMIRQRFGEDVWPLMANELAFAGGAIIGGLIIGAWGGFKSRTKTILYASLFFGAGTLSMGLVPSFVAYLIILGFAGMTMPMFNSPAMVIFQENVAPEMQGRVFGLIGVISSAVAPAAMILFGPLADITGVRTLLVITGSFMCVGAALMFLNKPMRRF